MISAPGDALSMLSDIKDQQREHFLCLYLNARNQVIHKEIVSIGSLSSAIVHPREVFRTAVAQAAASVILAHNHPSGDVSPSQDDINLTRRLVQAGEIMGIDVLDHLIIGSDDFISLEGARPDLKKIVFARQKPILLANTAILYKGSREMKDEGSHLIPVYIFDLYPYPDSEQGLGMPQKFLVLLKGTENNVVPITIGHFEGQALAMALRKIALPRPLPHDLLCNLLKRIDAVVHKLVVHTLKEDVFPRVPAGSSSGPVLLSRLSSQRWHDRGHALGRAALFDPRGHGGGRPAAGTLRRARRS